MKAGIANEITNNLEKTLANAEKIVINGAGHMVNLERPIEFNRAVIHFL